MVFDRRDNCGRYGEDDAVGAAADSFTRFPTREELLEVLVEAEPTFHLEPDGPGPSDGHDGSAIP